jgi:hypothetical protein
MAKVLMFHPISLEQLFVDPNADAAIGQLKEHGYIENPRLVAMHHPHHRKDVIVRTEDKETWEQRGYYAEPTIVYHPTHGQKQVSGEEAKKLYSQGWYDTPAKFPGNSEGTMKAKSTLTLPKEVA